MSSKDPLVLEFLDPERLPGERDLEQAIIDRLEALPLGAWTWLLFRRPTKRVSIDGDHFYIDLVFYSRLLRCFRPARPEAREAHRIRISRQIQMYANYF